MRFVCNGRGEARGPGRHGLAPHCHHSQAHSAHVCHARSSCHAGELYAAGDPELVADRLKARKLLRAYNQEVDYEDQATKLDLLRRLGIKFDEQSPPFFEPPLYLDYGYNITVGKECVLEPRNWEEGGHDTLRLVGMAAGAARGSLGQASTGGIGDHGVDPVTQTPPPSPEPNALPGSTATSTR